MDGGELHIAQNEIFRITVEKPDGKIAEVPADQFMWEIEREGGLLEQNRSELPRICQDIIKNITGVSIGYLNALRVFVFAVRKTKEARADFQLPHTSQASSTEVCGNTST